MQPTSKIPPFWLILITIGLSLFSETMYIPSLPEIATSLGVEDGIVGHTITIYIIGLSIGTVLWGWFSDNYGRKPIMLLGFSIYIFGCIVCAQSKSIHMLMLGRFIQGLGSSVGNVVGQAIIRDSFHGHRLRTIYSYISTAISVFPVTGPIAGGFIVQYMGWQESFWLLLGIGVVVCLFIVKLMPETNHDIINHFTTKNNRKKTSILKVLARMLKDSNVTVFALFVGFCMSIPFSYYAEGPFCLIEIIGLSPSQYGMTFIITTAAFFLGTFVARYLQKIEWALKDVIGLGVALVFGGMSLLCASTLLAIYLDMPKIIILIAILTCMSCSAFGNSLIISNSFTIALSKYRDVNGTASALFAFSYNVVIALATFGIGLAHNGTLVPLPIFLFGLGVTALLLFCWLNKYGYMHDQTQDNQTNSNF